MARNDDNKMSREEAGRLGGEATARTHDKDFYQEIGEKGGEATARSHDKEFYQQIGEKGGEARGGSNNRSQGGDRDGMSREEAGRKGGKS